jgi:hypothetical protein
MPEGEIGAIGERVATTRYPGANMNPSEIPESRSYRHHKCNAETVVDGQHFEVLSDPLSGMTRTWCNTCDDFFPLADFEWSDSGERITDYCSRHSARATRVERFLSSRMFLTISLVFGFLVGAIGGFMLFRGKGGVLMAVMTIFVGVIGVILFGSLKEFFLGKLIVRRVCGVSDTRVLK